MGYKLWIIIVGYKLWDINISVGYKNRDIRTVGYKRKE